jgi:hypothetical protein
MKSILCQIVVLTLLTTAFTACDDDPADADPGPFTLTFQGDASFQGAHGGQPISVALVQASDGAGVGLEASTVSGDADPAFSLTFSDLLEADESYRVHYWIDSNFGGGNAGACDGPGTDHQWDVDIGVLEMDRTHTEEHRPTETTDVCSTFASTLTFQGDASFQGAHGGQDIRVAILNGDGDVLRRASGVVSGSEDPSFSFELTGLPTGAEYRAHYWIDSNFGGGNAGTCDGPGTDHQWDVDIGVLEMDRTHTEEHRPTETTDVCSTFSGAG